MKQHRKIIHIDMDAFFAAVEQRDFPELRNKPIVVGGSPNSRGVVSTCSYEARKFGIHSAMPSAYAARLCPQAIFVKPRFDAYREASILIRSIFSQYTDLIEPLSLDEAYLDVSGTDKNSATEVAREIKQQIFKQSDLTASAGVSYNKFLAKIASDMDKPDGLFIIKPDQAEQFLENLPIGKFHGIGKSTEQKMHQLGVMSGFDLKQIPLPLLTEYFGKSGLYYYNICRGIDNRPVNNQRISKSIGVEITFQQDIKNRKDILDKLHDLLANALKKTELKRMEARTLTIKIKYHDFVQITRSRTLNETINSDNGSYLLKELLNNTDVGHRDVRLLGTTLSTLSEKSTHSKSVQMDLFN